MQRRNFIRHSGVALTGVLLHNELFAMAGTIAAEKLKVGVIGQFL